MATGDLKNNLRKLQFELRALKYDRDFDIESLGHGIPTAFLPIYHYAFVEYSHPVAEKILEMHLEMYSKTDLRFIETMYKLLRELFGYKPTITKEQFFNPGFGERKVMMCCDILQQIREMHKTLSGGKPSTKSSRSNQSVHVASSRKSTPQPTNPQTSMAESAMLTEFNQSVKNPKAGKRLSLHTNSSPLMPLVISETLSAVTREPALSSLDAGHETKSIAGMESRVGADLNSENGQTLDLSSKIDQDRLILNETRINSHQAIINNICEKLSEVTSKVTSMEERLSRMDASFSHQSGDNGFGNPGSADSDSRQLERSLENIVARLTLIENRLSSLEKQSKPLFPVLDSLQMPDNVASVGNKVCSDWTNSISSSPAAVPLQSTRPEPVFSSVMPSVSIATELPTTTKLQGERIEALLRETDKLLMKNLKHSPTAVSNSSCSEEKSDSSKEAFNIDNRS